MHAYIDRFLESKKHLVAGLPPQPADPIEEGGCGVVGFACDVPLPGHSIFEASIQMHNRGNGKGGGIAAARMIPEKLGVDEETLKSDYLLQIALLDPAAEAAIEESNVLPNLKVNHKERINPVTDYRDLGLEVRPPDVVRYFVRARQDRLKAFAEEYGLTKAPSRAVEDEFIYQNSFRLNQKYYAALGDKKGFVMSHARDLLIFKIVGYAENVVRYYGLEDLEAYIWIAHQRYPTKGRVWHPAGAHPFIGMNEALVHNGDFANYFSITEYLRQHHVQPQFLTDTEVSVLIFDMLRRTYGYPMEYVIEALAPTTELDFERLPEDKKKVYRAIQAMHMHGSPDGPWFFIIATSNPDNDQYQLVGITDTAMLRPQVFALQEGDVTIGLVGSEKQAIDATLNMLSKEDKRFRPVADRYWNARGGSHTDGGAFSFTLEGSNGSCRLSCADKFGKPIKGTPGDWRLEPNLVSQAPAENGELGAEIAGVRNRADCERILAQVAERITSWDFGNVRWMIQQIKKLVTQDRIKFKAAMDLLSLLNDRHFDCGAMKRSVVVQLVREGMYSLLGSSPAIGGNGYGHIRHIDWNTRNDLRPPKDGESVLIIDSLNFPMEGDDCSARLLVQAYKLGWKDFIVYGLKGQRFIGCGLGAESSGVRIDVFGSNGDYLASGIDGLEIHVHNNAQDQVGQIMKSGKLVIHGDAGQAFLYGAKGGEVYVLGNVAGRPLINAVGRIRAVINGTALDFLAESFMAGDPLNGGGFCILNGITHNHYGKVVDLDSPYPGANLFSLASGGCIYVRDPHRKLLDEQLNGGKFAELSQADWELIYPYLEENEKHFGISIRNDLLAVYGRHANPMDVYRKVIPSRKI
jgi:glutamate synthase domain-containing protein 1/glutamate synthase domain-containing protein 3